MMKAEKSHYAPQVVLMLCPAPNLHWFLPSRDYKWAYVLGFSRFSPIRRGQKATNITIKQIQTNLLNLIQPTAIPGPLKMLHPLVLIPEPCCFRPLQILFTSSFFFIFFILRFFFFFFFFVANIPCGYVLFCEACWAWFRLHKNTFWSPVLVLDCFLLQIYIIQFSKGIHC